jgi:hypothetical protein
MKTRIALAAATFAAAAALAPRVALAQSTPSPSAPPPRPEPASAPKPAADGASHLDLTTLKVLRDKGQITQAEYDSAERDLAESIGQATAGEAPTFVLGRFSTTVYGALKGDFAYDTTESYSDLMGNAPVQRPGGTPLAPPPAPQITYSGDHQRMQFSVHDSRFGLRIRAPESGGVRTSGLLEFDLFGQLPPTATEAATFDSSLPRVRHAFLRVETPAVDFLVGQYWHLFGWQNVYHPASVQAQGLPGELYGRTPQLRVSKTIATSAVTFEVAAAALRPVERDSGKPQGEAGLRIAINGWKGLMTNGAIGTGIQPLSVAVTGNFRDVTIPEMSLIPKDTVDKGMESIAVDGFIPVIPASKDHKDNALSIHGEFVSGNGSADLYTGLTGGITFPYLPNTTGFNPAPTYPQNIDNGIVAFDPQGNLHAIQWTSYLIGAQYYLPFGGGRAFIAGNYSHMQSSNIADFTQSFANAAPDPTAFHFTSDAQVRKSLDFVDGLLMADVATGVRVGGEYAVTIDHYVDGARATNQRVQAAGMFLF